MSHIPYTADEISALGLTPGQLPRHVAIIMDGNGRWAQRRGLPRVEGHRRGVTSVRAVVEECARLELDQLTLYCLSSENWKRPQMELELLLNLLQRYVVAERDEIMRQNIRFCTIGRTSELNRRVLQEVQKTIELSRENDGMRLCLALNYGGRGEIVDAVREIAHAVRDGRLDPDQITESTVSEHLYTAGMSDPDLVIRTASEMRVSNFLLWQISYAELFVTPTLWPEFREQHLRDAFKEYTQRERRFGGLKQSAARPFETLRCRPTTFEAIDTDRDHFLPDPLPDRQRLPIISQRRYHAACPNIPAVPTPGPVQTCADGSNELRHLIPSTSVRQRRSVHSSDQSTGRSV